MNIDKNYLKHQILSPELIDINIIHYFQFLMEEDLNI